MNAKTNLVPFSELPLCAAFRMDKNLTKLIKISEDTTTSGGFSLEAVKTINGSQMVYAEPQDDSSPAIKPFITT